MVRICVSGKHWPSDFVHTLCIPDSNFKVMQKKISKYQYLLFWLHMFQLKVNHTSFKKSTSFYILFLTSMEPLIQISKIFYSD